MSETQTPNAERAETPDSLDDESTTHALEWKRVHRITPFVRGWIAIAAILVVAAQNSGEDLLADGVSSTEIMFVSGGTFLVAIIVILFGWLSWRKIRYSYDNEAIYFNSGIVFRQERKVRLDRVQAIDIVRPLIARFFGLAELAITSASGGNSNIKLGFIKEAEAEQLRIELLARASGAVKAAPAVPTTQQHEAHVAAEADATAPVVGATPAPVLVDSTPESPERVIYEIPPKRIIAAALLSTATIITLILIIVGVSLFIAGQQQYALMLLPVLFGVGPYTWNRFVGEYGFTGAISPDGIRVRYGLLETRSKTIPPGRVQAVRIRQGALWRRFGWWRVDVNIAGELEVGGNSSLESILLPVGTRTEAVDALWLVLPDLGTANPLELLEAAMNGKGPEQGFTTSPRSARWLDPWSYRRNGFVVTDRALIIRKGFFMRTVEVIPHERTQSIGAKQGPMQRALGIASFSLHSTPGSIIPKVAHLELTTVRDLLVEQAQRAREARAKAGPEQWLATVAERLDLHDETTPDTTQLAHNGDSAVAEESKATDSL
ncbi:PH domain-containing protein [Timonella sp. A28]|uniref:PH domain-containing protein n=1 Tax=Timonella sp. A28 TaxID=3442640 RepID=UPI003EBBAB08